MTNLIKIGGSIYCGDDKHNNGSKLNQENSNLAPVQGEETEANEANAKVQSPIFQLPDLFKNLKSIKSSPELKDVIELSLFTLLSSIAPKCSILYDKEYSLNLYSFIVGPAGSGKSVAQVIMDLATKIDEDLLNTQQYGSPVASGLYLPDDVTKASLFELLNTNDYNLLYTTEAKSFSNQGEHFDKKDLVLKGFGNEPMSIGRKGKAPIRVNNPKISILLTGTPNSTKHHIYDNEDGSISRYLFYYLKSSNGFSNQFIANIDEHNKNLEQVKDEIYNIYNYSKNKPFQLRLNGDMESYLVSRFQSMDNKGYDKSVVRRGPIIALRIAAIIYMVNRHKTKCELDIIKCSSNILKYAIDFFERHLVHSVKVVGKVMSSSLKFKPLSSLTKAFTTQDYYQLIKDDVSLRTAQFYLSKLTEFGKIKKIKKGHYEKV